MAGTSLTLGDAIAVPDMISFPPGVVPTRRLYDRPLADVSASAAASQEKVTSYGPDPDTVAESPAVADGAVFGVSPP
jgi:hypothetical protein